MPLQRSDVVIKQGLPLNHLSLKEGTWWLDEKLQAGSPEYIHVYNDEGVQKSQTAPSIVSGIVYH